jgi:hypothetical protein
LTQSKNYRTKNGFFVIQLFLHQRYRMATDTIIVTRVDILPVVFDDEISFFYGERECINIPVEYLKQQHILTAIYDNANREKNKCVIRVTSTDENDRIEFKFSMEHMNVAFQWYKIIYDACR